MVKWIILAILLLPLAEIAAFGAVAWQIGLAGALLLIMATSLTGAAILRRAGREGITRFRAAARGGGIAEVEIAGRQVATVLAGFLLFLPGFLTDIAGLALLIPPLRRRLVTLLWRQAGAGVRTDSSVVDLKPDEWRQVPDPRIEQQTPNRPANEQRHGRRPSGTEPDHDCQQP